ncbi:MAG TPA: HIT family protein [Tepidisphaeraceae bacterium]|nr:HIT family protein [Tepidisphaeraceae bacterium]
MTCFLCQRIADIQAGTNPYFVTELETGYVVLGDFQCWRGYTLFISKHCKPELHHLETATRSKFLQEMATVAEAVCNVFRPAKLNYEMLGNLVPHMHWHFFPRRLDEPDRLSPVWERYATAKDDPSYKPGVEEMNDMRTALRREIDRLLGR